MAGPEEEKQKKKDTPVGNGDHEYSATPGDKVVAQALETAQLSGTWRDTLDMHLQCPPSHKHIYRMNDFIVTTQESLTLVNLTAEEQDRLFACLRLSADGETSRRSSERRSLPMLIMLSFLL